MTARIRLLSIGSLSLWAGVQFATAQMPLLQQATWRDDFENGSIDGWFSYPPFEDTAYDFTIIPGSYRPKYTLQGYVGSGDIYYPVELAPPSRPQGNTHYLLRSYRPNSSSPQRIGMARPLTLFVAKDTTLEFDYWLKPTSGAVKIELNLAGADGKRYVAMIKDVQRGAWTHVKLPASEFTTEGTKPAAGLELQALAVIADFAQGDASNVDLFAIDNVALSGTQAAQFELNSPETTAYKNWPGIRFAKRQYAPGETLAISVQTAQALSAVTARLVGFQDQEIVPAKALQRQGDAWGAEDFHRFTPQDERGALTLIISGTTPQGETVESRVRLWLVEQPKGGEHPRLFFTAADREQMRHRTENGNTKKAWESMVAKAKAAREKPILADGQVQDFYQDYLLKGISPYFVTLRDTAIRAMDNALIYAISGDEAAGAYAREALLKMSAWETWTHPWFTQQGRKTYYPVGIVAMQLGITYDLIYPLLSEEERAQARRGIMEKGVATAWQEYFVDNRIPENTSNWISHNTAAPLVALMAIYGDGGAADGTDVEPYFSGLAEKLFAQLKLSLLADGSYGEGVSYQNFTLESTVPFVAALSHALKVDGLVKPLHLDNTYRFAQAIQVGDERELLDMGDSTEKLNYTQNWLWLAAATRDPVFKSYVDQVPSAGWEELLWADDSLSTASLETLPASQVFPEKGNVVFRSGRGEDEVAFVMRAGANFNHTHADQGNFRLWGFGEHLIREADHGDYYEDPYYWSFYIQAAGHNTLLIDDNPESQEFGDGYGLIKAFDRQAQLTDTFVSDKISWATAELGDLYRGELDSFERNVYFIAPGYLIFDDHVRSAKDPHLWQWQLFPNRKAGMDVHGNHGRYLAEKAALDIEVIEPSDATLRLKPVPIPVFAYAKFPGKPLEPRAILQIENAQPNKDQDFLVMLAPTRAGATPAQAERISMQNGRAVRVTQGETTDELYLADQAIKFGATQCAGRALLIRKQADRMTLLAAKAATSLTIDGNTVYTADQPLHVAIEYGTAGENWTIDVAQDTQFTPALGSGSFKLDGKPQQQGETVLLSAGKHSLVSGD